MKNVNIFYWRKTPVICFEPKCQNASLDQNVNKLLLLDENVSNFFY